MDDTSPVVVLLPLVPETASTPFLLCLARLARTRGEIALEIRPGKFDPSPAPTARMALAESLPAIIANVSAIDRVLSPLAENAVDFGIDKCLQIISGSRDKQFVTEGKTIIYVLSVNI